MDSQAAPEMTGKFVNLATSDGAPYKTLFSGLYYSSIGSGHGQSNLAMKENLKELKSSIDFKRIERKAN